MNYVQFCLVIVDCVENYKGKIRKTRNSKKPSKKRMNHQR